MCYFALTLGFVPSPCPVLWCVSTGGEGRAEGSHLHGGTAWVCVPGLGGVSPGCVGGGGGARGGRAAGVRWWFLLCVCCPHHTGVVKPHTPRVGQMFMVVSWTRGCGIHHWFLLVRCSR